MKIEIKKIFHFFWRQKTPEFTLKVCWAYSNNRKNVQITETVAISVRKHPAKFGIKNL